MKEKREKSVGEAAGGGKKVKRKRNRGRVNVISSFLTVL